MGVCIVVVAESDSEFARQAVQAIAQSTMAPNGGAIAPPPFLVEAVEWVTAETLSDRDLASDALLIPLTLNLPSSLQFSGAAIYRACQSVALLRQQVTQHFQMLVGEGEFWLPVVLTAKGPLYCEVIGQAAGRFYQPLHFSDRHRQPLYRFAFRLLQSLTAPPATYLLQFGLHPENQDTGNQGVELVFDRLFPFPAEAAIASLGVQTPNLFDCHWRCLSGQPLLDIQIAGDVAYQCYPPGDLVSVHLPNN